MLDIISHKARYSEDYFSANSRDIDLTYCVRIVGCMYRMDLW